VKRRLAKLLGQGLATLCLFGVTAWGILVIHYLGPGSTAIRVTLAVALAVLGLAALACVWFRRARGLVWLAYASALVWVLMVWHGAEPCNDRDWQSEVAVLPYATFDGDLVTVHNIRNFDYRTETDFTPGYYDRTFELSRLDRVDLVAAYWMGPAVAHLFLTFGFGADHLAISIEARKDKQRVYATLPGFFRQYELIYVVADERDAIRVRTNYRADPPEDVYLYRINAPLANGRRVLLEYLRDMNALREHPRFYNTLATNCTTMILTHAAVNPGHVPFSWKILLSGYAPEYLYELGRLDQSQPFMALQQRSRINDAAKMADQASDFSERIRAGLP